MRFAGIRRWDGSSSDTDAGFFLYEWSRPITGRPTTKGCQRRPLSGSRRRCTKSRLRTNGEPSIPRCRKSCFRLHRATYYLGDLSPDSKLVAIYALDRDDNTFVPAWSKSKITSLPKSMTPPQAAQNRLVRQAARFRSARRAGVLGVKRGSGLPGEEQGGKVRSCGCELPVIQDSQRVYAVHACYTGTAGSCRSCPRCGQRFVKRL